MLLNLDLHSLIYEKELKSVFILDLQFNIKTIAAISLNVYAMCKKTPGNIATKLVRFDIDKNYENIKNHSFFCINCREQIIDIAFILYLKHIKNLGGIEAMSKYLENFSK